MVCAMARRLPVGVGLIGGYFETELSNLRAVPGTVREAADSHSVQGAEGLTVLLVADGIGVGDVLREGILDVLLGDHPGCGA